MVENPIKVYGRLKPLSFKSKYCQEDYIIEPDSRGFDENCKEKLTFSHRPSIELINNKPETHSFRFSKIFDQHVTQPVIFDIVTRPVVDSVLQGYNGTVFAYGQTGSGKTFSIIGGPKTYEDRGLIPRSIQYVFDSMKESMDTIYKVSISYFEIYNEYGYDLLDPENTVNKLEDLPRLIMCEDSRGHFQFRNLNLHPVASEKDALNLLFLGDTNRVTSETPLNPSSSRSHCVFTIHISARSPKSSKVRHSKMNLVDLAGSERVSKSGIGGRVLDEAKHINRSLHYLEQVIVGLSDPDRTHIPYRNSLMTTVLKDSLGGNCLTAMLATLSVDRNNMGETVSTCRFAQRVALVKNEAIVNEEVDPILEIAILREQIQILKTQQILHTGKEIDENLSPEEVLSCEKLMTKFIDEETIPEIPADMRQIRQCFQMLRDFAIESLNQSKIADQEARKFKELMRQKDVEIAALRKTIEDLKAKKSIETTQNSESSLGSQLNDFGSLFSKNNTSLSTKSSEVSHTSVASEFPEQLFSSTIDEVRFKEYLFRHAAKKDLESSESEFQLKTEKIKNIALKVEVCRENLIRLRQMLDEKRNNVLVSRRQENTPTVNIADKIFDEEKTYREYSEKLTELKKDTNYLKGVIEKERVRLLYEFREWSKVEVEHNLTAAPSLEFSLKETSSNGSSYFSLSSNGSSSETVIREPSANSASKCYETNKENSIKKEELLSYSEEELHLRFIARRDLYEASKNNLNNTNKYNKKKSMDLCSKVAPDCNEVNLNTSKNDLVNYKNFNYCPNSADHSVESASSSEKPSYEINDGIKLHCNSSSLFSSNPSTSKSSLYETIPQVDGEGSPSGISQTTSTSSFTAKFDWNEMVEPNKEIRDDLTYSKHHSKRPNVERERNKDLITSPKSKCNYTGSIDRSQEKFQPIVTEYECATNKDKDSSYISPVVTRKSSTSIISVSKIDDADSPKTTIKENDSNTLRRTETLNPGIQTSLHKGNSLLKKQVCAKEMINEDSTTFNDVHLTGDPEIDEEIIAFYRARNVKIIHTL